MINLVIFNVEIFIVMKISALSLLYATNETNPSTYHRTPSGKGLRPSFRPFCTIFLQPQEAVTKLFEFCSSLFLHISLITESLMYRIAYHINRTFCSKFAYINHKLLCITASSVKSGDIFIIIVLFPIYTLNYSCRLRLF